MASSPRWRSWHGAPRDEERCKKLLQEFYASDTFRKYNTSVSQSRLTDMRTMDSYWRPRLGHAPSLLSSLMPADPREQKEKRKKGVQVGYQPDPCPLKVVTHPHHWRDPHLETMCSFPHCTIPSKPEK